MGFEKILITCLKDNEASKRVIINNGGIYESTVYEPKDKVVMMNRILKALEHDHFVLMAQPIQGIRGDRHPAAQRPQMF